MIFQIDFMLNWIHGIFQEFVELLGAGGILLPYWELKKDCWGSNIFYTYCLFCYLIFDQFHI